MRKFAGVLAAIVALATAAAPRLRKSYGVRARLRPTLRALLILVLIASGFGGQAAGAVA